MASLHTVRTHMQPFFNSSFFGMLALNSASISFSFAAFSASGRSAVAALISALRETTAIRVQTINASIASAVPVFPTRRYQMMTCVHAQPWVRLLSSPKHSTPSVIFVQAVSIESSGTVICVEAMMIVVTPHACTTSSSEAAAKCTPDGTEGYPHCVRSS